MTRTKKTTIPPVTICIHCSQPVKPIEGKQLLKGNAASFRHVEAPIGCKKGDPLMDEDVR